MDMDQGVPELSMSNLEAEIDKINVVPTEEIDEAEIDENNVVLIEEIDEVKVVPTEEIDEVKIVPTEEIDEVEIDENNVVLTEEMTFNKKCRGDKNFWKYRKIDSTSISGFPF